MLAAEEEVSVISKPRLNIIHVAGTSASGKTHIMICLQNFLQKEQIPSSLIALKDLDDIAAGVDKDEWPRAMIRQVNRYLESLADSVKLLILVGYNNLGTDEGTRTGWIEIPTFLRLYIDLSESMILKFYINRNLTWVMGHEDSMLESQARYEEIIAPLVHFNLDAQKKLIAADNAIYRAQGYYFLPWQGIYNVIVVCINAVCKEGGIDRMKLAPFLLEQRILDLQNQRSAKK